MRIGIDARFYGSLGKGLGRYTQKLIAHLEEIDHENDYFILLRQENWDDYKPRNPRFVKVLADYRWYTLAEQILMPFKMWSLRLDCMHFTHFNVPLLYFGRFIVTIHDLILTKYPTERATTLGSVRYAIKQAGYHLVITAAVHRARKIIAVSQYTKKEIIEHFRIDPQKIVVTYEAVDVPVPSQGNGEAILKKYGVKQPYLLYVGNVYPHKNIEGLLIAYELLLKKHPEYHLVLVGKEDYFFRRIKEAVSVRHLEANVIFTGFVTDADLPELYRHAQLYVFPSFCEGFGLPGLEASSYDLPVVASNNSSLPEVLGPAALYFNPHDTQDMVRAMERALTDPTLVARLKQAGREQIKRFSWGEMAKRTLDLYRHL